MIEAGYFDGKTSRRHSVRLQANPQGIDLVADGGTRHIVRADVRVSEPIGGAPRTLTFPDGSYCEAPQGAELNALLAALDHSDGAVARWQNSWRLAAAGVIVLLVLLAAGYRWGLPWVAERVAPLVPPTVVTAMSDQVMQALDGRMLVPSQLPAERQQAIADGFRRMVAGDPALAGSRLLFRSAPRAGPNAFALPDGQIVLFDELVSLADTDDEVLGVLAHELAHVKYRHGLRQLIQSSVVAAIAASYFGDVSSLLSGLTALVLESKYSRGFELEADAFGANMMRRDSRPTDGLAAMLEKMERAHETKSTSGQSHADWLSSHPDTAERIARLRALR
jgi:Zn-dependent protease with chaperone function